MNAYVSVNLQEWTLTLYVENHEVGRMFVDYSMATQ